jgi:ATP adenylyltransferase
VIYQARGVTAFFPENPATLGHTLVVPNEHRETIWELDQGKARNLAGEVLRVAHAARDALRPEGLNIIQSNGEVASQTVAHVHVHVLPRWAGDAVGDLWPASPTWAPEELDGAVDALAKGLRAVAVPGYDLTNDQDREDRRKHLDLVSGAIARLAGSSAAAKGWAVGLAGTAFGVALARSSWPLFVLGLFVVAALGALDSRYLESERRARSIYDAIAEDNSLLPFSMKGLATSSAGHKWWWPNRFRSWSITNFYVPLFIVGVILLIVALLRTSEHHGAHIEHDRHQTGAVFTRIYPGAQYVVEESDGLLQGK